jgi:hypothetical protein
MGTKQQGQGQQGLGHGKRKISYNFKFFMGNGDRIINCFSEFGMK